MEIGRKHPALIGMFSSIMHLIQYRITALVMGSGALKLSGCWELVPVKSKIAVFLVLSTVIETEILQPWSK